jgi:hypothetical protein
MGCVALGAWFMPLWFAAVLFIGYTTFKELVFDNLEWGEDHESPDWLDWAFNLLGVATTCGALLLSGKIEL